MTAVSKKSEIRPMSPSIALVDDDRNILASVQLALEAEVSMSIPILTVNKLFPVSPAIR